MRIIGRTFERMKAFPAIDGAAPEAVSDQGEASEAPQGDSSGSELYEKTVPQLKEYAAEKGVDLSGARTKAEILAAINAAETDKEVQ